MRTSPSATVSSPPAAGSALEWRVARLEADNRRLRGRVQLLTVLCAVLLGLVLSTVADRPAPAGGVDLAAAWTNFAAMTAASLLGFVLGGGALIRGWVAWRRGLVPPGWTVFGPLSAVFALGAPLLVRALMGWSGPGGQSPLTDWARALDPSSVTGMLIALGGLAVVAAVNFVLTVRAAADATEPEHEAETAG